jgi:hypothetical protein
MRNDGCRDGFSLKLKILSYRWEDSLGRIGVTRWGCWDGDDGIRSGKVWGPLLLLIIPYLKIIV